VNWFYDNTFPPVLARAAGVIAGADQHTSIHLLDRYKKDPGDLVWIPDVATWPGGWMVLSGDEHLYRTPQNQAAVLREGLTVFVMPPSFPQLVRYEQAAKFFRWFPAIAKKAEKAKRAQFYGVRMNGAIDEW
jgi:hypothetical protein